MKFVQQIRNLLTTSRQEPASTAGGPPLEAHATRPTPAMRAAVVASAAKDKTFAAALERAMSELRKLEAEFLVARDFVHAHGSDKIASLSKRSRLQPLPSFHDAATRAEQPLDRSGIADALAARRRFGKRQCSKISSEAAELLRPLIPALCAAGIKLAAEFADAAPAARERLRVFYGVTVQPPEEIAARVLDRWAARLPTETRPDLANSPAQLALHIGIEI